VVQTKYNNVECTEVGTKYLIADSPRLCFSAAGRFDEAGSGAAGS